MSYVVKVRVASKRIWQDNRESVSLTLSAKHEVYFNCKLKK